MLHIAEDRSWLTVEFRRIPIAQAIVLGFRHADLRPRRLVEAIELELEHAVDYIDADRLVMNFEPVQRLPTAVLGPVLRFVVDASKRGLAVRLCAMSPAVREEFRLVAANQLVAIFATEEEAVFAPW